jgi:hypothetical protein
MPLVLYSALVMDLEQKDLEEAFDKLRNLSAVSQEYSERPSNLRKNFSKEDYPHGIEGMG